MSFRVEDNVGVLIKKAARLFEQVANKDLDKLGVTHAQTIFLIRLWDTDGQNQMELAKSASLKQPTAVRLLDRMERDKLITRVRNSDDRRVYNFYLTAKAKKVCQKLEMHANTMHAIAGGSISQKDILKLKQLTIQVIENLQQYVDDDKN